MLGVRPLLLGLIIFKVILFSIVYAGTEYVYVQKIIGDKAVIVRANGEVYLIEKGVGCISFWRYEGKVVLVHFPGIFLDVGSKLLIPDLNQMCRIWSSKYIGSIKTFKGRECLEEHWIESKSSDGSIIILEDGSVWEVDGVDRVDSSLWLTADEVIVCNGSMINLSNGEKVNVMRLK